MLLRRGEGVENILYIKVDRLCNEYVKAWSQAMVTHNVLEFLIMYGVRRILT